MIGARERGLLHRARRRANTRSVELHDLHEPHTSRVEERLVARVDDAPDDLCEPHVAVVVRLVAAHRDGRRGRQDRRQRGGAQPLRHRVLLQLLGAQLGEHLVEEELEGAQVEARLPLVDPRVGGREAVGGGGRRLLRDSDPPDGVDDGRVEEEDLEEGEVGGVLVEQVRGEHVDERDEVVGALGRGEDEGGRGEGGERAEQQVGGGVRAVARVRREVGEEREPGGEDTLEPLVAGEENLADARGEEVGDRAGARGGGAAAAGECVGARRVDERVEVLLGGEEEEAEHAQVHERWP
mmetsp:Transcript_32437/g.74298  ORF Transcript_32437/g.74298 Transcript_32437/m.74298 type:complete len:296 (+) Transcript_32437:357-1244(+)